MGGWCHTAVPGSQPRLLLGQLGNLSWLQFLILKRSYYNLLNGMDLTEGEDIMKRWQEYTDELYKKDLHNPDNHDGVITHQSQTSWNAKSRGGLGSESRSIMSDSL